MPRVSIIIPCYNEEKHIRLLLDSIHAQTFPRAEVEVIVADGLSTDHTREEIAAFQQAHPDLSIQIVDNRAQTIPAALNRAIEASSGEIIVRLDAHSSPYPDYVERIVAALSAGLADNVGGGWEIKPQAETWLAHSIAAAAGHPIGVGDALYRHAREAVYVDTVPFGAFQRSLIEKIGKFDETLLTNEDYEFNARIRQSGGKVYLDPAIRSVYFARGTLRDLWKQYFRYGFWKRRMLSRYPGTLRWRQALPPIFVAGFLGGALLSAVFPVFWAIWGAAVSVYLLAIFGAGAQVSMGRGKIQFVFGVPLAIAVMHFAWGAGFLWSMLPAK
jgi:glycosyltransferase involved in cell wall biosynthesis